LRIVGQRNGHTVTIIRVEKLKPAALVDAQEDLKFAKQAQAQALQSYSGISGFIFSFLKSADIENPKLLAEQQQMQLQFSKQISNKLAHRKLGYNSAPADIFDTSQFYPLLPKVAFQVPECLECLNVTVHSVTVEHSRMDVKQFNNNDLK